MLERQLCIYVVRYICLTYPTVFKMITVRFKGDSAVISHRSNKNLETSLAPPYHSFITISGGAYYYTEFRAALAAIG